MAEATGIIIIEETIRAPTVLEAMAIVKAIRMVKTVFTRPTGMPEIMADLESRDMIKSSLDKNHRLKKTTRARAKTRPSSKVVMVTIDPNKKELKEVESLTKLVRIPVRPRPAEVMMAMAMSEYLGILFLTASIPKAAKRVEATAPTIGLKPKARPAVIPAREEWDRESPTIDSLLKTMTMPIRGMMSDRAMPTTKAFCINS